ncbi:MAG: M20/M25/M40 family metallo-hydrolase [Acidobacteriia bacterium]|nr:M20/M25/M40 family metallo-hydrolase [Terriglobia bacterium]
MNSRRALATALVIFLVLTCAAQPADDLQQTTDRLASSVLLGPSMTTLRELTDGFGGRLTGSPAYQAAAEWAAAKFGSFGIHSVRLESFEIPNGWQRRWAHGEMVAPLVRPLHLESVGWTPSTPEGGIQGEVVVIDDFSADHIKAQAAQINGHVVLLDTSKLFAQGVWKALPVLSASYAYLKDAGALGILQPDREKDNVLNAHDALWGAKMSPLPAFQLGLEDSKLIRRLLDARQSVSVKLEAQNKTSGATAVNNVIAEIRGTEHPEEWILIGAHLDSWDFGTGAQDNGAGAAMVLEAARAIAALGQPPRRSIRFALWGGEEQGLLGSFAYTQAHATELEKCVAVLNTDNGAGHPKGWKVEGRKDLMEAMAPISNTLLKALSGDDLSMEVTYDTDHGPFLLKGVPAFDLEVDMSHYMEIHHKSSDTFDKVDALNFKADAAVVAVTAYAIAEDARPIAPHLDHAAVGEILKKAGLDEFLKSVGVWNP